MAHESPLELSVSGGSPGELGNGIHLTRQLPLPIFLSLCIYNGQKVTLLFSV